MKRRDALKKLSGAAVGLGSALPVLGNIEAGRRIYGAPATLDLRRAPEENLIRLALARQEIPYGVWEETSALARLAASVAQHPEAARNFARDPAQALRSLGYDPAGLRLDAPEVRTCLLLADEAVQQAVADGDALGFIRALRERGVEPEQDHSQLKEAFREAFDREYEQRLRAPGVEPNAVPYVLVVVVLVAAAVVVAVAAAVTVLAAVYVWVTVSGGGGGAGGKHRKDPGLGSLFGLAVQTGNPDLSRDVHARLLDEMSRALGEAAIEAADAHGVRLSPDEAERQVRNALAKVMP